MEPILGRLANPSVRVHNYHSNSSISRLRDLAMHYQQHAWPITLLDLLHNSLVLGHIGPYLGMNGLLKLAATSKSFHDLIYNRSHAFGYVDLTNVESCRKRSEYRFNNEEEGQEDPSVALLQSSEEFYARPLRKVFCSLRPHNVLRYIRTLILDGLVVPAVIVRELLCDEAYNIRILSLRGVGDLGSGKLLQVLRYVMRPSRPEGTPKLKGLYVFTPALAAAEYTAADLRQRHLSSLGGVTNSVGAQLGAGAGPASSGALHKQFVQSSWHQSNPWYSASGTEVFSITSEAEADQWSSLLEATSGLIAFDAVLCRQKSHIVAPLDGDSLLRGEEMRFEAKPALANISLSGCQMCGSCPEGPAYPDQSPEQFLPLLVPPPLHASTVKAAQRLHTNGLPHPPFIARCRQCLKDRWCERCNAWWCESCYKIPGKRALTNLDLGPSPKQGFQESVKVHNTLCVSNCLIDQLLTEGGEGGMWG